MNRYRLLRTQLIPNWYYFLCTAFLTSLSFFQLKQIPQLKKISLGDSLGFLFLGIKPLKHIGSFEIFSIPLLWLSLFVLIFYSVNIIVRASSSTLNYLTFFSLNKRTTYWSFKVQLVLLTIFFHFIAILLTLIFCVIIFGGVLSFNPSQEFLGYFMGKHAHVSGLLFSVYVLFIPWFVCSCLGILELCFIYFFGELQSFIVIITYLIVSIFFQNSLFLGNYLMLVRSDLLDSTLLSTGVGIEAGFLITILYATVFYMIGYIGIKRWDYMN